MDELRHVFRPHRFDEGQEYLDLYHVYDNLSRTPFRHGIGIECEDLDEYIMNPWHVITPQKMRQHLDWRNRQSTQFISFYGDQNAAIQEQHLRRHQNFVPGVGQRDVGSVRIAHVRLPRHTGIWVFSRDEMLDMMQTFGPQARLEAFTTSGRSEWFVWGHVPEEFVYNRHVL